MRQPMRHTHVFIIETASMRLRNIPFDNNNNISGSGFAHM